MGWVSGRQFTRRELLRRGGQLAVALPVAGALPRVVAASTNTPPTTRGAEWAANADLGALTAPDLVTFAADFPFNALGAHYAASSPAIGALEVSVSAGGGEWSAWMALHPDEHGPSASRQDRRFFDLALVPPSRLVRYRAVNRAGELFVPGDLRFVYIDATAGPTAADYGDRLIAFEAAAPKIVSRAGWGADERLRFDKKGKEIWEPEYYTVEKVIIHHTDTPNTQDPLLAIRSVYYYHAVTKGWGDIGYNYLVDRNGVTYEGRFGGDNVVGGHAYQYNYGSVGIGVIGSFSTTPDPPAAERAVSQLTAYKGRFIDPLGKYFFVDKMIPNVVGHRDVLSTACPGDAFYPRLPTIRQTASTELGSQPKMAVEVTRITSKQSIAIVGSPATIRVTVKNTGSSVLPSYYDKGLAYTEGDTFDSKGKPKIEGRFRITIDAEGSPTFGTERVNPYRWGFGRSINPGETVDVDCRIVYKTTGVRPLRVGLVQEYIGYVVKDLAGPSINVIGKPTDPAAAPAQMGPELAYFTETRHTLRGPFLRYWERFGGLAQFGFPLTEEFPELSDVDGQEYQVQYFERARFEHHPEHKGTDYEVLLGLVGLLYHKLDPPAVPLTGATQRYFTETKHNLGGAFRYYWEQFGGLFVYGYPLTEEFREKSRIDGKEYTVQYFERARFEFHPENSGKSQVLLGHLGRQMLQERGWL